MKANALSLRQTCKAEIALGRGAGHTVERTKKRFYLIESISFATGQMNSVGVQRERAGNCRKMRIVHERGAFFRSCSRQHESTVNKLSLTCDEKCRIKRGISSKRKVSGSYPQRIGYTDSASGLSPKGTFRFSRCNLFSLLTYWRLVSLYFRSGFLPSGVF